MRAAALQQVNSELSRKHQELDAIVQTAPDIIFSRQEDGARDYISDRFYEFTGAAARICEWRRLARVRACRGQGPVDGAVVALCAVGRQL